MIASTAPVCIPGQQEDTRMAVCARRRHLWGSSNHHYRGHQRQFRSGTGSRKVAPRVPSARGAWGHLWCRLSESDVWLLWGAQVILSDRIAVVHHHPNLISRYVSCCPRCWGRVWSSVLLCASFFPFFLMVLLYLYIFLYIFIYSVCVCVCVHRNTECANIHCTYVLPSYIDVYGVFKYQTNQREYFFAESQGYRY